MNSDDLAVKSLLETVHSQTGGDTSQHISMYEAGQSIGLEKTEARSLAEELIMQGLLELMTLAGGVAITQEGMDLIGATSVNRSSPSSTLNLTQNKVLDEAGKKQIQELLEEIKEVTKSQSLDFAATEELLFDIKTIEIQLFSPRPKSAIFLEVLRSIQELLTKTECKQLSEKLGTIIN